MLLTLTNVLVLLYDLYVIEQVVVVKSSFQRTQK